MPCCLWYVLIQKSLKVSPFPIYMCFNQLFLVLLSVNHLNSRCLWICRKKMHYLSILIFNASKKNCLSEKDLILNSKVGKHPTDPTLSSLIKQRCYFYRHPCCFLWYHSSTVFGTFLLIGSHFTPEYLAVPLLYSTACKALGVCADDMLVLVFSQHALV